MAMDVYFWFRTLQGQMLFSCYDNTLNWILFIANHINIWYLWLLQMTNLSDVKLPNIGCHKCQMKLYSIILVIDAASDFRILQKEILLLWDHSLLNTAPLEGTDLVAFESFHHNEWHVVLGKTSMRYLNVICYDTTYLIKFNIYHALT